MDDLRRRAAMWPVAYFALVSGGLLLFFRGWTYDDPFITFRYAANLAEGLGFVYNPGERVLSTTSPLFAVLLAGFNVLGFEPPAAAHVLGALSLAAGGLLLWDIASRLEVPAAGWACAALYPTSALLVSTLSSETPLYLALCLAAFSFYLRERYTPAAILLGLAVLTRADAALVVGLLAGDWLFRTFRETRSFAGAIRAVPLPAILAGLAVVLPWAIFGWSYFGSPLPATLSAKQAHGLLNPEDRFLPGLLQLIDRLAESPGYLLLFGLAALGLGISILSHRRWLPLLIWPLAFTAGYTFLGVTRSPWYYASLVPGTVAAAGLALGILFRGSGKTPAETANDGFHKRILQVAGLAILLILTAGQISDLTRLHDALDPRYPIYREIGLWLAENAAPEASVATLEVGIIGYYARAQRMIDFAGLIQPEIAARFAPGSSFTQVAAWAAVRYEPDMIVLPDEGFGELRSGYIRDRCESAADFSGVEFGYEHDMVVYICD